jgi:hypothetical protein
MCPSKLLVGGGCRGSGQKIDKPMRIDPLEADRHAQRWHNRRIHILSPASADGATRRDAKRHGGPFALSWVGNAAAECRQRQQLMRRKWHSAMMMMLSESIGGGAARVFKFAKGRPIFALG